MAEVEQRLDRNLAEADALQNTDPELAARILAREAELAAALNELDDEVQAQRARSRAAELADQADAIRYQSGIKPVAGGVTDVACPGGGVVQVAGDIASAIERLLADAAEAGYPMCGYGYHDPAEQIAVRRVELRHLQLRHLPGTVVVLLAADGPPGHVDARAGPGHRLHRRAEGERSDRGRAPTSG